MKKVIALILGGGQGTRLFPLTMYRSKPAVPIAGKYRLIDMPISNCLHSNIKDIYVLTQFNSESLNNHINNTYRFDYFSRAFVRILAAEQTREEEKVWFQGTADAVRRNLVHLRLQGHEEILVLSGDHIYEMDYAELIHFHRRRRADFTVSVIPVGGNDVREFGIVRLGANDRIRGFIEKPTTLADLKGYKVNKRKTPFDKLLPGSSYLASMGIYIFNARVLLKALESPDLDFGREVFPHCINRFKSAGYIFNNYWRDIGNIRSFYDANIDIATQKPFFSFIYKGTVFTRPRFLPPARINDSSIAHSLVTEGCIIGGANIDYSVIGLRSVIGKGCRISRTVLMGADYYEDEPDTKSVKIGIGDGCIIDRAIIDKNVRIGRNVRIRNLKNVRNFDGENHFMRDGIVIIPKNTTIKDGTVI